VNGPPRLLVVDDDPLFRSLLVSLLREDYLVSVAKEGSEGFYKAVEQPPDIAIIDVRMPGWDGLRTLRALRQHHATARCRVLMLTGDASRSTVVAAFQEGANDYLVKANFTRAELERKLEALLATEIPGPIDCHDLEAPHEVCVTAGTERSDDQRLLELFDGWE
jgi:DNA-binding response OmpR family regulator